MLIALWGSRINDNLSTQMKDDRSRRISMHSIPTTHQTLRRMLPLRGGHFVEAVVHRDRA
jgi:hypothetical protein